MKNTILKFEKEEVEEFIVSDYFSKKVHIIDIYDELEKYVTTYQLVDNDKIERISYELYGSTDYWDILVLLNGADPLFHMAYGENILLDSIETSLNKYLYFIYSHAPLSDDTRIEELTEYYDAELKNDNERIRFIYVIKPENISDAVILLKKKGYL